MLSVSSCMVQPKNIWFGTTKEYTEIKSNNQKYIYVLRSTITLVPGVAQIAIVEFYPHLSLKATCTNYVLIVPHRQAKVDSKCVLPTLNARVVAASSTNIIHPFTNSFQSCYYCVISHCACLTTYFKMEFVGYHK